MLDARRVPNPEPAGDETVPEVSVTIPCLNEADTLAVCIEKAQQSLRDHHIAAEIIVADNGSTDGSQAIAARMGAVVVTVQEKGYGSALMGGIAAARGRYVIMGDADSSYDFGDIPKFLEQLRAGADLVGRVKAIGINNLEVIEADRFFFCNLFATGRR